MRFEPLRFLHAANVRLDRSIAETVPLSPQMASIVQDAALAAFDRLIGVAIERKVDFVLLVGNTFSEAEQSLAARLTLVDGFQQLDDEGIRVFVLPGPSDPESSWRAIPDLPANVKLLPDDQKKRAIIKRDGHVIARVGRSLRTLARKSARFSHQELRSQSQRPSAFIVGAVTSNGTECETATVNDWSDFEVANHVASDSKRDANAALGQDLTSPVNYVALGGGARRTIARHCGIAHDPGPVQGAGPCEQGPCGCTLVNVESDGTIRCDFVATASVRWEQYFIDVEATMHRTELLRTCRSHLDRFRAEPGENAWIFEWVLRGSSQALAAFDNEQVSRQFQRELSEATTLLHPEAALHFLKQHQTAIDDAARDDVRKDPLESEILEALAALRPDSLGAIADSLPELETSSPDLKSLIAELDLNAIMFHAHRCGRALLRAASTEEAVT